MFQLRLRFPLAGMAMLTLALACQPAWGQDEPATRPAAEGTGSAPSDDVSSAFALLQKARQLVSDSRDAMRQAGADDPDARAEARSNYNAAREAEGEARTVFLDAFSASEWRAMNAADSSDLAEAGLWELASQELKEGDPLLAAEALEKLIAELPDCGRAKTARIHSLPAALALGLELPQAIERLEKLREGLIEAEALDLDVDIGDLRALSGDVDGARKLYQAVLAAIPEDLERRDSRARLRSYARMREALVGKSAPEIHASAWVGDDLGSLEAQRGKVVALDFWATWCGPCRAVMPHLDELVDARAADGLVAIGLTRHYPSGYLPEGEDGVEAESVREMDEAAFLPHLQEFRKRMGSRYPYAVGIKEDFEAYEVSGIPTIFMIDAAGIVRYVKVGSGNDRLLDRAADILLAEIPAR